MLSHSELVQLKRLARETLALLFASIVMPLTHWVEIDMYAFAPRDKKLFIAYSIFSSLIAMYAALIFFTKGGARVHYPYLVIFCLILYPFCILALYTAGTTVYVAATMKGNSSFHIRPNPMWLFSLLTAVGALCAIITIVVTLNYPSSKQFLHVFQKSAKSTKIFLPKFLFVQTHKETTQPPLIEEEEYTIKLI